MSESRRSFLHHAIASGGLVTAGMLAACAGRQVMAVPGELPIEPIEPDSIATPADVVGSQDSIARPDMGSPLRRKREKFDDSWTKRLGKYRVVFEMNRFHSPAIDHLMASYQQGVGASDKDLGMVVVVRHAHVAMFVNDAIWQKHQIGVALNLVDPSTKEPYLSSPYLAKIDSLSKRGVIFLGCNIGFEGMASRIAKHTSADVAQVREDCNRGLHGAAILQPNGVYAILRAQNAGCAYWKLS